TGDLLWQLCHGIVIAFCICIHRSAHPFLELGTWYESGTGGRTIFKKTKSAKALPLQSLSPLSYAVLFYAFFRTADSLICAIFL
ncbi:MAG: hypothetical protein RSC00_04280, partial [Ruthenibacterium sp.]